ncbi:MAG: FIST N-terminal domain-containing protein [Verrucomicrobiota bacterium]
MRVSSHQLTSALVDLPESSIPGPEVDLVIAHGNPFSLEDPSLLEKLCDAFPNAHITGCSSAGEMLNGRAYDNSIVYAALQFDHTTIRQTRIDLPETDRNEHEAGRALATALAAPDLALILLFSEGLAVDCDELIKGIHDHPGTKTPVFGGLAGDNLAFEHTVVLDRTGVYGDAVVAVGFYGDRLEVSTSTSWFDQVGSEVEVTCSEGNLLTEIDGLPALDVFMDLVGDQTEFNPSVTLNFPFIIQKPETRESLYCRTVHEIVAEEKTLLSAGTVPEGPAKLIKLLKDDFLMDARRTSERLAGKSSEFAMAVSCAARRGAMGDDWMSEFPVIQQALGDFPCLGFYSYGEIGDCHEDGKTIVHNHTLTIATFHEA